MKTDKWHSISEVGGMTILLPPGFVAQGGSTQGDTHSYLAGHRYILIGSGPGPSNLTVGGAALTQLSDCETVLNGRRAELTSYTWVEEDDNMAPTGQAGPQYMAVARFFSTGSQREVYVAFKSNIQSDIKANRQLFWSVSFPGSPAGTLTTVSQSAAPAPVAAPTPAAAPTCVPKSDPTLPAASAVVDSAVVQMLMSGSGPMPKGYAMMALTFDGSSLSGVSVAQSDLPDASQKQLATLIASNLKPHNAKTTSSFVLRVETLEQGLHYSVLGACGP